MHSEPDPIKLDRTKGRQLWLSCSSCSRATSHEVVTSVSRDGYIDEAGFSYLEEFEIVQCKGCSEIAFRKASQNSDDFYLDDRTGQVEYEIHEEVFPPRLAGRPQIEETHFLPFKVREMYRETHKALCSDQKILAGAGIRALVESVCKDKEASGKNLVEKIESLAKLGVLTAEGASILDGLRILGNKAIHDIAPHGIEKLIVGFEVIEHLLKGVYILPGMASNLGD